MRPLTTAEALLFHNMMLGRLFGWARVLGRAGGRHYYRSREAKRADAVFRRLMQEAPLFDTQIATLMAGGDIASLWPHDLQTVIRFQIEHKPPEPPSYAANAPSSAVRETGADCWLSDCLANFSRPAMYEDHPPLPPQVPWEAR